MEERLYIPEISEEEFVANVERDDFLLRYGNPVRIREKNGKSLVCMAIEYYERMTRELEDYREDEVIRYWVLEFEMPPEVKANFERIARANEMTPSEFFEASLLSALEHPSETAAAIRREYEQHPDEDFGIRLVRKYPVYKGETEAQAHKRALAEEAANKTKEAAPGTPEENAVNAAEVEAQKQNKTKDGGAGDNADHTDNG